MFQTHFVGGFPCHNFGRLVANRKHLEMSKSEARWHRLDLVDPPTIQLVLNWTICPLELGGRQVQWLSAKYWPLELGRRQVQWLSAKHWPLEFGGRQAQWLSAKYWPLELGGKQVQWLSAKYWPLELGRRQVHDWVQSIGLLNLEDGRHSD